MRSERLPWALGWVSLKIGLTELAFPQALCRVLGVRGSEGWVKVLGLREVVAGLGLLLQPHRQREWIRARVAGDVVDLALLAATFRKPRANRAWQAALTVAVAGVTLVDLIAATRELRALPAEDAPWPGQWTHSPTESWRGSGLAESVGDASEEREEPSPEVKERMMKEAARTLGLPERDSTS